MALSLGRALSAIYSVRKTCGSEAHRSQALSAMRSMFALPPKADICGHAQGKLGGECQLSHLKVQEILQD